MRSPLPRALALAVLLGSTLGCNEQQVAWSAWSCRPIRGAAMPGPEDFDVEYGIRADGSSGPLRLIVSVNDRRGDDDRSRNGLYAIPLDENQRPGTPTRLEIVGCPGRGCAAAPHGISLVREAAERHVLWVINHDPVSLDGCDPECDDSEHSIERYLLNGDQLVFERDLRSAAHLRLPNDLVGLRNGSLYITNVSRRAPWLMPLDLVVGSGDVVRYDGQQWSTVRTRLRYANGITVTGDGGHRGPIHLYVAELLAWKLHRFEIEPSGELRAVGSPIELDALPDNMLVGLDGTIWTAAHPNPLAFLMHAAWAEYPTQSAVYSIDPDSLEPTLRFANQGLNPAASSTAIALDSWLFVGQVFEDGIIACGPWDST